jgi:2-oxoglutarate/2-oxoacid ferredoxin oxidoreductase subunit alpha
MQTDNISNGTGSSLIRTIAIGGAAGDGIREAGINFSELLHELGYTTFTSFDYPSLIRGGHNFARISYTLGEIHADYHELDVLIAVNAESVRVHANSLKPGAHVFVESAFVSELKDLNIPLIPLPMKEIATEVKAPMVARTSSAFGAYGYTLGIPLDRLKKLAASVFANVGAEVNIALVQKGYTFMQEQGFQKDDVVLPENAHEGGEVMDGNKAVAKGFLSAGLEAYVGYPMTPSTSTLQFLAKAGKERGLKVVHPEDEIAVINVALGMSYAGKRVAVGTANGGFALMQETFAFAGVSELPLAILVAMRMGPATGVATHTSQGDLRFIIHAGHGEFPRLVMAPGDIEECFSLSADALNLAWKYQIPVILLTDKHLSESYQSVTLDVSSKGADLGKREPAPGPKYKRYTVTEDGVSPMAFPGTPDTVVKATSYEHNEEGEATEHAHEVLAMQNKRFRKLDGLYRDFAWFPTVKTYGDLSSDVVIVFWGSTKGAMLEALKQLKTPAKLVQILWLEPFDADRVKNELAGARIIIDVEANHTAQLASLIREKTSIEITNKVLKYDAQPFTPTALAEEINRFL